MIRRMGIVRLLAVGVAIAVCAGGTNAGLLPASVTVQSEAGNFRWTYAVVLPTGMSLQAGNSFTIYDFAGYQAGSGSVNSTSWDNRFDQYWTLSTSPLSSGGLNPQDDPDIVNVTWTYTGPTVLVGQTTLGNFTAVSQYWGITSGLFTGTDIRSSDGQTDSNIVSTWVPQDRSGWPPVSAGPEPGTLVLAGLGLPLIGLGRVLYRKRTAAI